MHIRRLLLNSLMLCAIGGCSSDWSTAIDAASTDQGHSGLRELPGLASLIDNQPSEASLDFEKPVSSINTEMPSPERTNPFSISAEFENEGSEENLHHKQEIRVVGFIELDTPSVMLSVDGKSHMYKQGETLNNITVNEVTPPTARITCDGISRVLSLFDQRTK